MKDLLVVLVIASHRLNDPLYPVNRAAQPLTGDEGRKITIQPLGISAESHLPHEEVLVFIEVAVGRKEVLLHAGKGAEEGGGSEVEVRFGAGLLVGGSRARGEGGQVDGGGLGSSGAGFLRLVGGGQKDGRHLIAAGQADCASEGRVHHKGAIRAQLGGGEGGEGIEEERRGFLVGADGEQMQTALVVEEEADADDGHDDVDLRAQDACRLKHLLELFQGVVFVAYPSVELGALRLSVLNLRLTCRFACLVLFLLNRCQLLLVLGLQLVVQLLVPAQLHAPVSSDPVPGLCWIAKLLVTPSQSQSRHYHSTSPSVDGRELRVAHVGGGDGEVQLVMMVDWRVTLPNSTTDAATSEGREMICLAVREGRWDEHGTRRPGSSALRR
ncbi:hypothetical protein KC337_g81 [Hortaea werneckii]|nr:hypothetical protein KC337_g81 [Hortaea werneckii]